MPYKAAEGNIDEKSMKASLKENLNTAGNKAFKALAMSGYRNKFDKYLEKAGILFTVEEMLVIILFSMTVLIVAGGVLSGIIWVGIGLGILYIMVFRAYVEWKIQKRIMKFDEQLGNTIDMIVSSLRGGFSFLNSMEIVAKDMPKPISDEFGKVLKEVSIGFTQEKALNNLVERVPSEGLKMIVTAAAIQTQTGGNLAEILDNISSTIRERVQLKREVKALTSQGKMSGWVLGLLPIFLALVISTLVMNIWRPYFKTPQECL
ncbi:MAG: type II secretion system F family protein [Clostridiaceae bacterium]